MNLIQIKKSKNSLFGPKKDEISRIWKKLFKHVRNSDNNQIKMKNRKFLQKILV